MDVELFVTAGLGDNSYLVVSGAEAALVDPQRDPRPMLASAEARGASVRWILETHVHNDYVSGSREAQAATGAEIVAPAGGGYRFPHRPVTEGDELALGSIRFRVLETPGHTPEHVSYLLLDGETDPDEDAGPEGVTEGQAHPSAVFTGGSLIVGSAGRTDLLGEDRTVELTRAQFRSVRRLGSLPPGVEMYPTHGAGSFCATTPPSKERTSTIGEQLASNAALAAPDEQTFVREQLSGLLAFPAYYRHMAPINREGPRPLSEVPALGPMDPGGVAAAVEQGAWIVDGRPRRDFASAHVPGSVNVELDEQFGSYVGWIVPFGEPLVLVVPEPETDAIAEARAQLVRIGYERVLGYLSGGIDAWRASGRAVRSYGVANVEDLCGAYRSGDGPAVLDVRQDVEWESGHIPGSRHVFVGDLPARVGELSGGPEKWVVCRTGHRSAIAASLLDRAGIPVRLVAEHGVPRWLKICT